MKKGILFNEKTAPLIADRINKALKKNPVTVCGFVETSTLNKAKKMVYKFSQRDNYNSIDDTLEKVPRIPMRAKLAHNGNGILVYFKEEVAGFDNKGPSLVISSKDTVLVSREGIFVKNTTADSGHVRRVLAFL